MAKTVKFSDLSRILCDLGFSSTTVPGSHHLFKHRASDATIMLPLSTGDGIQPIYIAAIGRTLDEKGLLARDEFEQRVYSTNGSSRSGVKRPGKHARMSQPSR